MRSPAVDVRVGVRAGNPPSKTLAYLSFSYADPHPTSARLSIIIRSAGAIDVPVAARGVEKQDPMVVRW